MRFRKFGIGTLADIEGMFMQISIKSEDRSSLGNRFIRPFSLGSQNCYKILPVFKTHLWSNLFSILCYLHSTEMCQRQHREFSACL